jgi:hypothetical protein
MGRSRQCLLFRVQLARYRDSRCRYILRHGYMQPSITQQDMNCVTTSPKTGLESCCSWLWSLSMQSLHGEEETDPGLLVSNGGFNSQYVWYGLVLQYHTACRPQLLWWKHRTRRQTWRATAQYVALRLNWSMRCGADQQNTPLLQGAKAAAYAFRNRLLCSIMCAYSNF